MGLSSQSAAVSRKPLSTPDGSLLTAFEASRKLVRDDQINIKSPLEVVERFSRLCHDDWRIHSDMLALLMEGHERQS